MEFLRNHPVIPVLSIDDIDSAEGAVSALQDGGIKCVEVALRSANALSVLAHVCDRFPNMVVGAGSIREPLDFIKVIEAGAAFGVSPGCTRELLEESQRWDLPYLPAAATVSELLTLMQTGVTTVKMFPAGSLGGAKYIKDVSAPLPGMQFVPSGGVNLDNMQDYLKMPVVPAVSGSWMLDSTSIKNQDWQTITDRTKETLKRLS